MDFEKELEAAIQRGQGRSAQEEAQRQAEQLTQDQIKRRHNDHRIHLSEHAEKGLKRLADHFPGFQYESVFGDKGWGGAIYRDDLGPGASGRSASFFSRLELVVRPLTSYAVVDLFAKGTIRNKELFSRNYFREIQDVDEAHFIDLIDRWILEYAEQFAAANT